MKKLTAKLAVLGTVSALLLTFSPVAFAGDMPSALRTLSVSGEGKITVQADKAVVSLTVESTEATPKAARQKNNQTLSDVRNAMVALGLDAKDVTVDYYSGYPNFEYKEDGTRKMSTYSSTFNLSVKVKDLSKVDQVLERLADFENINLSNTSYLLENSEAATDQAREKAVQDARKKAEKLAKSFGMKLGDISSLYESSYSGPSYAAGQNTNSTEVTVTLSVGYEMTK